MDGRLVNVAPGPGSGNGTVAASVDRFLTWAVPVARALVEWHEREGTHGRLRPTSIVVSPTGEVRLAAPDEAGQSLAYIAPEQTGRLARGIDERSDLYVLGVLFYQALTGRLPFDAVDALEWVHCHLARQPRPPGELVPGLPAVVGGIVSRLLAKQPEERYQTARGLAADLERCLARRTESGRIDDFPLGAADLSPRLVVSDRLYGRAADLARLRTAFDHVASAGRAELVCVTGDPGIGKSALIRALAAPIAAAGGRMLAGKFDRYRRAPFATVADLLAEFGSQVLAESGERLAAWRRRLTDVLGGSAAVLVGLAPVLGEVLGVAPPTADQAPLDARNRTNLAARRFLAAIAAPGRPLVLVLDDLQWVDPASLEMLTHLLTHPDTAQVLVIGAYRPGEVGAGHPLAVVLAELAGRGLVSHVPVGALPHDALCQLLADTLHHPVAAIEEMAPLVARNTGANPLFVGQFLHRLDAQDALWFDAGLPGWRWDLDRIRQAPVTDNVVALVAGRIGLLDPRARRLLTTAALLGDRFDLATLAAATGERADAVAAGLRPAVDEHLIVPADAGLHATGGAFRWTHDRIRQATLSRIPPAELPARQVAIGWALADRPGALADERLFTAADHLNAGIPLLTDPADRTRLAALNLTAAGRARRDGANDAAQRHVAAGLRLLPADAWPHHYELTFALHIEAILAANLAGDRARVEQLLQAAAANARDDLHRLETVRLRLVFALDTGEVMETFRLVPEGLALLGLDRLAGPDGGDPLTAVRDVEARLCDLRVEDIVDAPEMTDPHATLACEFIAELLPSLHADRTLFPLLTAHGVGLTLQHGPTAASAPIFSYHGTIVANRLGDDDGAVRSAEIAVRLGRRFRGAAALPRLAQIALLQQAWYRPPAEILALLLQIHQGAVDQGDLKFAAYIRWIHELGRFVAGIPLDDIAHEVDALWATVGQIRVDLASVLTRTLDDALASLRGRRSDLAAPPDTNEAALIRQAAESDVAWVSCVYLHSRLVPACILGDYVQAGELAEAMAAIPALEGTIWTPERAFFHALALAATAGSAGPDQRRDTLDALQVTLDRCAARGPVMFSAKALLVSAERARLAGEAAQATGRYDQAMGAAREHGMVHVEAIAAELAGRYALGRGATADATNYLDRAVRCYQRWGAAAKVDQLIGSHRLAHHGRRNPPNAPAAGSRRSAKEK